MTGTIRSGVFSVKPFNKNPGALILAMVCAEFGAGTFVAVATKFGFPVSTTHSIVGALVGVGIASVVPVNWKWKKSSYGRAQNVSRVLADRNQCLSDRSVMGSRPGPCGVFRSAYLPKYQVSRVEAKRPA